MFEKGKANPPAKPLEYWFGGW